MEELLVVEASDKWRSPNEYTYHVHIEELLDIAEEREIDQPEPDEDGEGRMFVDRFCWEDGEVVGVIAQESRSIGRPLPQAPLVYVDRDEISAFYGLLAELLEDEIHYDV